jgi:molybdopterin/thiamine biosynthesis adenylyltransferase
VGAGGLGCPAAQALAAAGVGCLRIIDGDRVELSNLHRQVLHHTPDIGRLKVDSVRDKIARMNPEVTVEAMVAFAGPDTIASLLDGCDYVIEACDGQGAKFLVNDACVYLSIPFTIAGVVQFYGQILSVIPGRTRCLRCLFREPSPDDPANSCSGAGVMGTAPGLAATLQANEALKSILGLDNRFTNRLFVFNLLDNSFDSLDLAGLEPCPACLSVDTPWYRTCDYPLAGRPQTACPPNR